MKRKKPIELNRDKETGFFKIAGDEPLSKRIYGTRVHVSYEEELRSLPNTSVFIREAIEKALDERRKQSTPETG